MNRVAVHAKAFLSDINDDWILGIFDAARVMVAYGSRSGNPNRDSVCDVNEDGVAVAVGFGKRWNGSLNCRG